MLILVRRGPRKGEHGQSFRIDHPAGVVTVQVLAVAGGWAKLGISGPRSVRVWRTENDEAWGYGAAACETT